MAELSKVNVSSTDYDLKDQKSRDALVDAVDDGAKNFAKTTTVSFTTSMQIEMSPRTGIVVLSARNIESDDTLASQCAVVFNYSDGSSSEKMLISRGYNVSAEKTLGKTATRVTLYASDTAAHSTGKTAIFTDLMICTKPEWDISHTYVPYGKTNAELTSDLSALSTENISQQSEIDYAINTGVKNVLPITNTTSEVSGITFTVNADNTVTSLGTLSSGSSDAVFECSNFQLPAGTYTYTCEGAAQQTVRDSYVQKYNGSTWDAVARDYENNTFTITQTEQIRVRLRVYATGTSGTFKPMIRRAEIADSTFVPYSKTNRELTVAEDEDRAALISQVDSGAKNLMIFDAIGSSTPNTGTSIRINGITFTIQNERTITAYGTATAGAYMFFYLNREPENFINLFDGKHIWSGLPEGYTSNEVAVFYKVNGGSSMLIDPVSGTLPYVSGGNVTLGIQVQKNQSYTQENPLVIKPMICTSADYAISPAFVPYAPTNRDLYEEKIGIEDVFGVRPQIADNTDLNTLQTIGKYVCGGFTKAQTLLNCPMQGAFIMLVDAVGALTRLIQRIYGFDTNTGEISVYIRALTINGWGSWYKFEGTEVT